MRWPSSSPLQLIVPGTSFKNPQNETFPHVHFTVRPCKLTLPKPITTHSFEECVLKAVNLGGDTDTTGCVAGGLAGVHYGERSIPEKWKRTLARHNEVDALFKKFVQTAPH